MIKPIFSQTRKHRQQRGYISVFDVNRRTGSRAFLFAHCTFDIWLHASWIFNTVYCLVSQTSCINVSSLTGNMKIWLLVAWWFFNNFLPSYQRFIYRQLQKIPITTFLEIFPLLHHYWALLWLAIGQFIHVLLDVHIYIYNIYIYISVCVYVYIFKRMPSASMIIHIVFQNRQSRLQSWKRVKWHFIKNEKNMYSMHDVQDELYRTKYT